MGQGQPRKWSKLRDGVSQTAPYRTLMSYEMLLPHLGGGGGRGGESPQSIKIDWISLRSMNLSRFLYSGLLRAFERPVCIFDYFFFFFFPWMVY